MAWNEPGSGGNNPFGGRGGGSRPPTPPDVEEIIRQIKARFGIGGKGDGAPPGTGAPGPLPSGVVGLALLGAAALWLASGFYLVEEKERAVVTRFGKYIGSTGPGPHWHLPWPIDRVQKVGATRVQTASESATMLTQDENIVDVEVKIQYRVSNVEQYVFSTSDPIETLSQATKSAVREIVGQSTMDFILTDGREEIADRTKQILQDRLDQYKTGILITEVNLQQAQPPAEVQEAFADVIKAREDQQRLKSEAEAHANQQLPKARGEAARMLAEAAAYRDQVVARAEGDAARFTQLLAQYRKAPKVTRERLYLETMQEVMVKTNKVLIDVDKGSPMMYLPLEQLMKSMPRQDAGSVQPPLQAQPSAVLAQPPGLEEIPRRSSEMGGAYDGERSRSRER